MAIFILDEEKSKKGVETLHEDLARFGAEIEKEEPFGDRDLTYEVKKQNRGRFVLFTINVNPGKLTDIDTQFKLNENLLKYLFVKIEDKKIK